MKYINQRCILKGAQTSRIGLGTEAATYGHKYRITVLHSAIMVEGLDHLKKIKLSCFEAKSIA